MELLLVLDTLKEILSLHNKKLLPSSVIIPYYMPIPENTFKVLSKYLATGQNEN